MGFSSKTPSRSLCKSVFIAPATLWLFVATLSAASLHAAPKVITLAALDDYPPYCFRKEPYKKDTQTLPPGTDSTALQGFSWDIVRESFHAMGYSIQLEVNPWSRAMQSVKNGKADLLFPAGKNSEREAVFYYAEEPASEVYFLLYVRADSTLAWDGLQSLKNLRIGHMREWNYGEEWTRSEGFEKIHIDKIIQGFRMLEKGRIDGFASYETISDFTLRQEGLDGAPFKKSPPFGSSKEYCIGPQNERTMQLLKDFDAGKHKIIANGTMAQILKKWE